MIRPLTLLCASAFVFSGFHLYQTKHLAQEVDRSIVQTMREVTRTHNHAVLLRAEYALLNDPTRLQELAQQYLALRPTAPTQFVAMTDLASRLPPVGPPPNAAPPAEAPALADFPIANAAPAQAAPAEPALAGMAGVHPAPAHPAPAHPAPAHAVAARPAPMPAPVVVAANPPMQAVVRSVARAAPRREAPVPLHPGEAHGRSPAYVPPAYAAPVYAAPGRPVMAAGRAYAPPPPVRARYEPPTYSGTPFEAPQYASAPARPMGGSVLGMAYGAGSRPSGGNR